MWVVPIGSSAVLDASYAIWEGARGRMRAETRKLATILTVL